MLGRKNYKQEELRTRASVMLSACCEEALGIPVPSRTPHMYHGGVPGLVPGDRLFPPPSPRPRRAPTTIVATVVGTGCT
jgi:hypothetical protein